MERFKHLLFVVMAFLVFATTNAFAQSDFKANRTDFRDETIYFAMTTRFYDGDPMNNVCGWDQQATQIAQNDPDWRGDFKGLIDKLDYIKALGFTAIWITPVVQNASGTDFHGYHAMDMSSVDLRYESRKKWGSSEDVKFQDLIDKAHAKGLKIILDVVLQHTGNFGEVNLNPLFTRSQNIKDQASVSACMIPNSERLSNNYFDQAPKLQYAERFKYFKNPEYDKHNYYHHYGTGWNWDLPNRWWGQIAGDCVDLNTENDAVAEYVVKCYGEFIEIIEKEHRTTDITHLNIVLPRDTVFATFDLDAGAGNITVEGLKCRNADIDLGAGNVVFDSLDVSGYADIDAGAGQLTVKDGSVNNLDFDMGVGETVITSLLTGNSSLDCGVGNLELNVKAPYENFTVDVEKGLGAVNINNQHVSSDSILGSGSDKLEISGGLGNITVTFEN